MSNFASSWDVISWINGLLHYNAGQFKINLLNVRRGIISWIRSTNTDPPRTLMIPQYFFYSVSMVSMRVHCLFVAINRSIYFF